jgi:murein DD-endopeptidase MepM/ murein hydrolase activator NlpD
MKGPLLFVLGGLCGASLTYYMVTMECRLPMDELATHPARHAEAVVPASPPSSASSMRAISVASPTSTAPVAPIPIASAMSIASAPASAATTVDPGLNISANTDTSGLPSPQGLLVPVEGVRIDQLADTFDDARAAGRIHDAIDIMAPRAARVLAVADGKVVKLFNSVRGGLTVYQFDPTNTFCYYYAHLDSYAPELSEGKQLRRGDPIGFVGSSGDANPAAPHLHFEIHILGPGKNWWQGMAINPYPILTGRHPNMPQPAVAPVDADRR